jgi:uncharacterized Zn-finger protein
MADRRLNDPTQTHFTIKCPGCGQQYAILGLMVQDQKPMACSRCNAVFRLRIGNNSVEPELLAPATGGKLGPAEDDVRG